MSALPQVATRVTHCTESVTLTLNVEAADAVFDGHFPGNPVLAGVAQIDWAARFAQASFTGERAFTGTRMIKFLQVVRPPATLGLDLTWQAPDASVAFRYYAPTTDATYSRGTLCFG